MPKLVALVNENTNPLGEALAAALGDAQKAHGDLDRHRKAIERVRRQVYAADGIIKAAEERVRKAQREFAEAVADAAVDGSPSPASPVREARRALEDASEERDAARAAGERLRADLPALEDAARAADAEIERAINGVLAQHVECLVAKARPLVAEVAGFRDLLLAVLRPDGVGPRDSFVLDQFDKASRAPLAEVEKEISELFAPLCEFPGDVAVWRRARAALRQDPYAVLDLTAPPAGDAA